MALILEDGTALPNSNTYALEATFSAWLISMGYTITKPAEELLLNSMVTIEAQKYKGSKLTKAQALQWPRSDVVVDGFDIDEDEIPTQLINAQMQCAYDIDQGNNPSAIGTQAIKSTKSKVDVIEKEIQYQDNTSSNNYNVALYGYLSKLLANGSGMGIAAVICS